MGGAGDCCGFLPSSNPLGLGAFAIQLLTVSLPRRSDSDCDSDSTVRRGEVGAPLWLPHPSLPHTPPTHLTHTHLPHTSRRVDLGAIGLLVVCDFVAGRGAG